VVGEHPFQFPGKRRGAPSRRRRQELWPAAAAVEQQRPQQREGERVPGKVVARASQPWLVHRVRVSSAQELEGEDRFG
jgi:hypothetical protein